MRKVEWFIFIYFILAIISLRGFIFQQGTVGHRWDWCIPPTNFHLNKMTSYFLYTWNPSFLGGGETYGISSQFIFFVIGLFSYLGINGALVSKWILIFVIVVAGSSMFFLIRNILISNFFSKKEEKVKNDFVVNSISFLGGYFYAFSPLLFNMFSHGALTHFFVYAVVPLVFLLYRKAILSNRMEYLVFSVTILAPFGASLKIVILMLTVMFIYGCLTRFKIAIKMFVSFIFIWGLFNSYWITPLLFQKDDVVLDIKKAEDVDMILKQSYVHSPHLAQSFDLTNYVKFTDKSFFQDTLGERFYFIWHMVITILVAVIFTMLLYKPKEKEFLIWVLITLLSFVFVTGVHPPLGGVVRWMYLHFFIFVIYQSVWVFNFLPTFTYSILLSFTVYFIKEYFKKRYSTIFILSFLLVTLWVVPFYSGNLGGNVDIFRYPEGYFRIDKRLLFYDNFIRFRILYLPLSLSPKYLETEYQRDFQGSDPIVMWSLYPSVVSDIVPNVYIKDFVSLFERLLYQEEWKDKKICEWLALFNIKYIILRKDVLPNFGKFKDRWSFNNIKDNLKNIDCIRLISEYKYVSLWKNFYVAPYIYSVAE